MTQSLYQLNAWVIASLLLAGLVAVWAGGLWWGRKVCNAATAGSKVDEASLALMGLLLGFTFAMALQKHDNRREKLVEDSNSIGDFYTTASLLREPVRSELRDVVREYARYRLELARTPALMAQANVDQVIGKINAMHGQMTELVRRAVDENTPVVVPLVGTLNNLTSSHAARLAAARDRLPGSIVALLFLAAIVSAGVLGRSQGIERKRATMSTLFFIVLITSTLYITLDLNQPGRGLIRVSQEPMERLLVSMGG
ncbi:MAG: hypothetical protein WBD40_10075 [Tepidisphaeraceae bacterium]